MYSHKYHKYKEKLCNQVKPPGAPFVGRQPFSRVFIVILQKKKYLIYSKVFRYKNTENDHQNSFYCYIALFAGAMVLGDIQSL